MKTFIKGLTYYVLIPLISSLLCFALSLAGLSDLNIVAVPLCAVIIYILFRKKIDIDLALKVNGIVIVILLLIFTIMMLISSGNIEGVIMSNFAWFIFPFAPIILISALMGLYMQLYLTAFLTYIAAFVTLVIITKTNIKKYLIPGCVCLLCIGISTYLYCNRPSVKYGGHGFDYMYGYSSTDFTDYMVYSKNSKLVILDQKPSLIIEKQEDMPILDGAEALYPLYAAYAKNVYKDIDKIELKWLEETQTQYPNGKVVTFTNTINAFDRLLYHDKFNDEGTDMFFGAYPSEYQLQYAEEMGVELEITPIGREAFVFFVDKNNTVDALTSEQIKAIYHGDITNWKQVGGKDEDIIAFQRPSNSGSQTRMEYFMGDVSLKEPKTYEKVSAMSGVIKEVAQFNNEKGAMGYTFRYFLEELNQEEDVKMLSVDGVYPSIENIENGTYPLISNVCLITRKNESNPYVSKMIDFILSEQGQEIMRKTGYAPIR